MSFFGVGSSPDAEARPNDHPASGPAPLHPGHKALCTVSRWLAEHDYHFTCPSPETHARVNGRRHHGEAQSLREVFGWSRPFRPDLLPPQILEVLKAAELLEPAGLLLRCRVRFSSLDDLLFAHSAFPTTARDAVFFGPDTYRFANFLRQVLQAPWPCAVRSLADIGCGSGAGAILAASLLDARALSRVALTDINPRALAFAASNAAINLLDHAEFARGDGLDAVKGRFDLIITNAPYIIDRDLRTYCHGGAHWGTEIAVRFLRQALSRLEPGGRLALYTGTPVINGQDAFRLASLPLLETAQVRYRYEELDPDVFGEELDRPEYAAVERIAAVGLVAYRPGGDR